MTLSKMGFCFVSLWEKDEGKELIVLLFRLVQSIMIIASTVTFLSGTILKNLEIFYVKKLLLNIENFFLFLLMYIAILLYNTIIAVSYWTRHFHWCLPLS